MKSGILNLEYIYLALLWTIWCAIHSLLISRVVVSRLKERYGDRYRFYRVFFNLVSIVTLVPVLIYSNSLRGDPFFSWSGAWRPVQLFLAMGAIALFYTGGKHYDLWQFLGVRQVRENESRKGLTETGGIDTSGILGVIRHPWYTAAILIIWARPLNIPVLVTNAVLTSYLFVGTVLEERKLVAEFGEEYRNYQKRVPMFFPWKRITRPGP
ncbi:isoprenylcysteine carboxylmethyltransferase family protein [bacterium]|nr:isoprenylcysteine carboxylmethyltransferase family protein [bacterium]